MENSDSFLGNVLILDDEEMIRTSTGQLLEIMGYQVFYSEDGEQALRIHQEQIDLKMPINVMIMDLTIPNGMGGVDCITKIREIDTVVFAVVSSGDPTNPVFANFTEHGFNYALAKPYTLDAMKEMLSKVIL